MCWEGNTRSTETPFTVPSTPRIMRTSSATQVGELERIPRAIALSEAVAGVGRAVRPLLRTRREVCVQQRA